MNLIMVTGVWSGDVSRIHPLGNINVGAKFHCNPANICQHLNLEQSG